MDSKTKSVLHKFAVNLSSKRTFIALLLTVVTAMTFMFSMDKLGIQSLAEGDAVIGNSQGGIPIKFNAMGGGSSTGFTAAEVPVLLVSLDNQDGPYLPMTNGYEAMITHYGNWLPTSGDMKAELAFVPNKAVSNINANSANDKINLAWYNSGADHLLMSSPTENGWYNSIFTRYNGAGDGSDPTGGAGVYRNKLKELKDAGNLRDWRTLVTDATKAQSKKVWGSFATVTGSGSSYSWDVSNRIRNYMQLQGLDLDNYASWSAEDSNKASLAYMDLLMTLYSCSTGTPENASEWESAIDRYINNGFLPGQDKCNENIVIYPGVAMQVSGNSGDRMVMSCGDAWNYAYHINPEYSLGSKGVALNKYGPLGVSDVYQRLFSAATDNRNAYPQAVPYLNNGGFSYVVNYSFAKKIKLSTWQLENVANTRKFIESLYMEGKDGTKYYGLNIIPSIPMEVTGDTSKFNVDFDVVWSTTRSKHLIADSQTVGDAAQLRINMKIPEAEKATWETIFEKYTDFQIAFNVKSNTDTGRVTRTTKTDGGQTSALGQAGYQVEGREYTPGAKVDIEKANLKSLLWGYKTYDGLYEQTTKSQSINLGELQTYGYDLQVTIYYKNATSQGSSVTSEVVGHSKDTTDGQRAKHKVTAFREENPPTKATYYSDPEAFAEIKEGTVERNGNGSEETWEAMAGVPSTETLYFTSGGSEFIVELELEFVEGEKAERWYQSTFFGTECEFKRGDQFKPIKASGTSSESSYSNVPTIIKEKFTTNNEGIDTGAIEDKDAEWYQGFKPDGAASAVYDLQGHAETPRKEDGTSVVTGSSWQQDNESMNSTTITAMWTGTIANQTPNPGITGDSTPSGTPCSGSPGVPGVKAPESPKWDMTNYDKALKQAEQWAKAYESTNATYTAKKMATGDQNTRIWKIGNATISVQITGPTSNGKARSYSGGSYTTANVISSAQGSTIHPNMGEGWNLNPGNPASGSCSESGKPPVHKHGSWSGYKKSTTSIVGSQTYTIKVTFDNGTYEAHELCGPCCQHRLPQIFDTWTQKSQYDYARINTMRVFKIHRSYVNDMEEITFVDYNDPEDLKHTSSGETLIQDLSRGVPWMHGALDKKTKLLSPAEQAKRHNGTDTIVAAISQGDPNIFYNIANEADYYNETSGSNKLASYPSKAGRLRYSFQAQRLDSPYIEEITRRGNSTYADGYSCEEGSRSNKCDGLMRTISSQNPVKVVGRGHEDPQVNATAGLYEGTINTKCFSNGILYSHSDWTADQTWMETLTQAEVPSCNDVLVAGTVETAGKGTKKQGYNNNTIDDKDYLTEEYHRMRYRRNMLTDINVVSDMLLLQTSSGDQPVMYYVAPKQTKRLQQHFDYTEADKADNPGGEFRGTLLKNKFENMWINNPTCANNWGQNNIGQDADVNVGSYLGLGDKDPSDKFSDTGKHQFYFSTIFDNTGGIRVYGDMDTAVGHLLHTVDGNYEGYAATAEFGANKHKASDKWVGRQKSGFEPSTSSITPGNVDMWGVDNKTDEVEPRDKVTWLGIADSYYVSSPCMRYKQDRPDSFNAGGERRKPRVSGLRIFTDEIRQDPTNVNKEYITGEAKQTYHLIKDYDKSTNFVHEFNVEDIYAWDEDDGKIVDGFVLDAPYTRDDTKVNDIVVQNPVSVESAAIVHRREVDGGDFSYDTRADNELAGAQDLKDYIDGLDVCPGVADLCDFRILNCSFDTDKVLFSTNFEPSNMIDGKEVETVYEKTGADGIKSTYVVNTTDSNFRYELPNGFTVSNDKIKYIDTSYDIESGKTGEVERWWPVFGDTNNDIKVSKGNNHYLACFGDRWSIPLSDLKLAKYDANTKVAVEFDFYMHEYSDEGTMLVSFNNYDFYIPGGQNLGTWNTGNSVEKQVKSTSFIGGRMKLKLLFDFSDAHDSELYINNEKLRPDQYRIVNDSIPITEDMIGDYLNIGSWGASDAYPAKFYIDNLKITKIAGDRFHTDACYRELKQHEPAIQYTCQALQTFTYDASVGGKPELYTIPQSGRYKIEAYGAQGGGTDNQSVGSHAGLGGYSYGFTHFDKGQKVLVYPGGSGGQSTTSGIEYFWILGNTSCGTYARWAAACKESMSGINYINSVSGNQEVTNGTIPGMWAETCPTGFECGAHSVSVAINNATGKMVSRVKDDGSGFKEGINTFDYGYSGGVQTFTAPVTGTYTFEVWGAAGGNDSHAGGLGGYSKGSYVLAQGQTINIYVGGVGGSGSNVAGGWNGGGRSGSYGGSGSGGGASDIRVNGTALGNRVIVAGGGGGGGGASNGLPGGGAGSGNNGVLGVGSNHTYPNISISGTCDCYHCGNRSCGNNYCSNHRYACSSTCRIAYPISGSDGGGGGGGYYGGAAKNGDEGAYGGSNYIGGVTNGSNQAGVRSGHGYAKITTPYIAKVKYPTTSSAGWNGGGTAGNGGFGGGGATDIRILNYGGEYSLNAGMAESGVLTYGPYIAAGKGHYQADIYGKGLNKCKFDAYTNTRASNSSYNPVYEITDIKASDTHVTLYFEVTDTLPAGDKGLEVRVHHEGVVGYRFDKMYISRLEDRVIVGGGGGGADNAGGALNDGDDGSGGYGGGLVAGNAYVEGKLTKPGVALTTQLQPKVDTIKDGHGAWKALDGIAKSGCGLGAGQNYGFALGYGESYSFNTDTGGAGGGYFGGYVTNHNNGGAGGGSGYVDGLQKGVATGNSNPGPGLATIHMIEHEESAAIGNTLMGTFDYTGNVQEFTAQVAGNYYFETWGAAGGDGRQVNTTNVIPQSGGAGAYASGVRYLNAGEKVYIYVGGKGGSSSGASLSKGSGGWNGGGDGGTELSGENYPESGAGGGGATDIRTSKGNLASRFLVAAGGGGAGDHLPNASAYGIPGLQTMKKDGKTWARVLYQDISQNTNYFTTANMKSVNQSGLFSCIGQLEKFRQKDGKFTFMLRYPDATGGLAGKDNVWRQKSNPLTEQTNSNFGGNVEENPNFGQDANGFETVSYPMSQPAYGKGIEFNGVQSIFDGAVNHGNWWLCVGIMNGSYAPTNTASKPYTMPGPTMAGVAGQGVSKCELWVAVDDDLDVNASTGLYQEAFGGEGGAEVGLSYNRFNKGGTQSHKTLGVGAAGYSHNEGKNYGSYGGGGGGYYGGYWEGVNTNSISQGGAGGSSYIGKGVSDGVRVAGNGLMPNPRASETGNMTGNEGNGYARVWLKNDSVNGHTSECSFINGLNNIHVHNRACLSETNKALVSALDAEWGGNHYLLKSMLGETLFNKLTNPQSVYTIGGFTKTDYKQFNFGDCAVTNVENGKLHIGNFGANPAMSIPVSMPAGAVTKIVADVELVGNPTTVGEVYWVTNKSDKWGQDGKVTQAKYDPINKQYVFDVSGNPHWSDTITSVSFDFVANNTPGGEAIITSIDFIGSGAAQSYPEPTSVLKSYSGFTPDSHHGVVDGGKGTTSFSGNAIQSTGNAQQLDGWEFKLPVNISALENIKFIKVGVINLSNSSGIGVDILNNSQHYFSGYMIPNSDALQEVIIPVNWSGSTDGIWFDPAPGNKINGTIKITSIDIIGYGTLTENESTVKKQGSQTFNYTGNLQVFTAPENGNCKFEVWGAAGGGTLRGKGGYASGNYYLSKGQSVLLAVGGQGAKNTGNYRDFGYSGNVQAYTAPVSGKYKLETWGAMGSSVLDGVGGYGGYSTGEVTLTAGQTIYVVVGGTNGYNGGQGAQPGGGATHIASTNRGELFNYDNFRNEVYLVAGGGGAAERVNGGSGGGTTGGSGNSSYESLTRTPGGGTQSSGGTFGSSSNFGNGQPGTFGRGGSGNGGDNGPTGGGGWYGGGGIPYAGGAGGGSGYIGGVSNGSMINGMQGGAGYARITLLTGSTASGAGFNGGGTGGINAFGGGGATDIVGRSYISDPTNNLGSLWVGGGTTVSNNKWVLANNGSTVHIHTGLDVIHASTQNKIWRLDVWGDNVDKLSLSLSYLNGTSWIAGGGEIVSTSVSGSNHKQFFVKATTGYSSLAFCVDHLGNTATTNINNLVLADMSDRLLVAGGGGGSADYVHGETYAGNQGGNGGGTTGGNANIEGNNGVNQIPATGGTQSSGGVGGINKTTYPNTAQSGGFGYGGSGNNVNMHNGGGAGGGYYGGGGGAGWYQGGGAGGSSFTGKVTGGTTSPGVRDGNGMAKITYDYSEYKPATIAGHTPARLTVSYQSSLMGLDGTQEGVINAINNIANYIDEIPDPIGGEFNPIFNCDRLYNTHICTEACDKVTKVLDCQEPHHYGMHYTKATADHDSCYEPCLDDSKHKKHNHQLIDVDGKHIEESIYINTDEYFSVFFPNVGDFYESDLHGIGSTTQTRGMSYIDQMKTSKWTREKYVKFNFDSLFYREETGLWEQYKANTWIELPVKGEGYPYYNFYCTLDNPEIAAAHVEFASEGINAKDSKGKYNYKNWQGSSDEDDDEVNADDWVYKNIDGKKTASNHRNNNDNPTEETNKDRRSTLTSLHGAHRDTYVDLVGRIGNFAITDTDDFRWCNMFKVPRNDGTWIVDGIIQEVIETEQNNYLSWHYNNGALAKDIRNRLVDKPTNMYDTWGTQEWKSAKDDAANALAGPLGSTESIANNPEPLERDLMKPGYNVNFEITTTGNYQQYLQVKPYFYALCVKNDGIHTEGTMYPVDVHMNTEEGYKPINLFGAVDDTVTWNKYKDEIYDYILSLNWDEEALRRNYTATEQAVTENIAKIYTVQNGDEEAPLPIPSGRYYALGTAQIIRAEGNARTFIGSEHTVREEFNAATKDNTNFDDLFNKTDYEFKAQRWHLKLGIPSSAVFTFYDEVTGERHNALDEITWNNKKMKAYEPISESGNYVIVMTANIKALGETWNLYYSHADGDNDAEDVFYDNGVIKLNGKNYVFDDYIGPLSVNMDDVNKDDLRKRVVDRTGLDINSDEVARLTQKEYNKIMQERFRAQNRVIIAVYDASSTSQVDVDIIGTH